MRLITLLFCSIIALGNNQCYSQKKEYKRHLNSIRKNERKTSSECVVEDSTFLDYAMNRIIKPEEIVFISDRNLLSSIPITSCTEESITMAGKNGRKTIAINIKMIDFDTTVNKVSWNENDEITSINGEEAYGSTYDLPMKKIESIEIIFGCDTLNIAESSYSNLYNPNTCENSGFTKGIMAYQSLNGDYLYLYIIGGNGADTYFSKLIFNHKKHISTWVADYYPLSCYGCFRKDFIGF
jgi:hypothetical protein